MRTADVEVHVTGIPQVREMIEAMSEELVLLRTLVQSWEPRVRCPQCGQRYLARACGPDHALIMHAVQGK